MVFCGLHFLLHSGQSILASSVDGVMGGGGGGGGKGDIF